MNLSSDEARQAGLLAWLVDQGSGEHDVAPFYVDVDRGFAVSFDDVKNLESRGLVSACYEGGGLTEAGATSRGRTQIERLRAARGDRASRRWACRAALLRWLGDNDAIGQARSKPWTGFLTDPTADFYGQPFEEVESDQAAGWLHRQDFIGGIMAMNFEGPVRAFLTDKGLACVEDHGGDVRKYREATERTSMPSLNVTGENVQVATGQGAHQVINTTRGVEQFKLAITGLLEIVQRSDLAPGERELDPAYKEAIASLATDTPAGGPAIRLLELIADIATRHRDDALAAMVATTTNALLSDARNLFRQEP